MPAGYVAIKVKLRKQHPDWSDEKVERVAAKIWNKMRAGTGQTVGKGRE